MATVLTNAGRAFITGLLDAADTYWAAWGTGAGTAGASDTSLFTEAAEDRETMAASQGTENVTDDTLVLVGTLTTESNQTITNAGVFTDENTGILFLKGDFTGVALETDESIQFTWRLTFA